MDLQRLNEPQTQVVLHGDAPLLVLAGAGTGKTTAVTYRIAHLMLERRVSPRAILAMTFTNKAAREMRERAGRLAGVDPRGLDMGTFHGICARMLRIHGPRVGLSQNFLIYDADDQLALIKRCAADLNIDAQVFPARSLRHRIEQWKNQGLGPKDAQASAFDPVATKAREVYGLYRERCIEANAVDFGDLLLHTATLVQNDDDVREQCHARWSHILVDEYQDTNPVQSSLLKLLVTPQHSITVVGDDDQSIYRWRGADVGNILRFERDFPGAVTIRLEQNYRSTETILSAANAVIAHNAARKGKTLFTHGERGSLLELRIHASDREEAEATAARIKAYLDEGQSPTEVGILYRINAQSRVLEDALRRARIPHAIYGGVRFYDRREIKDAMAYLRLLLNSQSEIDFLRVVNVPARGIGKTSLEAVADLSRARQVSLFAAAELAAAGEGKLTPRARRKLGEFVDLVRAFTEKASSGDPLGRLLEEYLEASGYLQALRAEDTSEAVDRLENLQQLIAAVDEFVAAAPDPSLLGFLEEVALASDIDGLEGDEGQVSLMTMHSAKGLEFAIVFMPGLEEGLFPHSRSLEDRAAVEEERRLCYVGLTRARKRLHLSAARMRTIFGELQSTRPSRFLSELPPSLIDGAAARARRPGPQRATTHQGRMPPGPEAQRSIRQRADDDRGGDALSAGARVFHATFGEGLVRASSGSGARQKLTVDFSTVGQKVVVARFLERV